MFTRITTPMLGAELLFTSSKDFILTRKQVPTPSSLLRVVCGLLLFPLGSPAQEPSTVTDDRAFLETQAVIRNASEAELIIRVGDIDNLGFGWPEGFDPFCGRMTNAHEWPWAASASERPGFDRILLSSRFRPDKAAGCGADGYSASFDAKNTKPVPFVLPTDAVAGLSIQNAWLQLFIDDFQAPSLCSKFTITLNGKRFIEGERLLNAIDQTGPVGKLLSIPVPEEFWSDLSQGKSLTVMVDEVTGTPDGFAVDFVRLLVNRKRENTCKGTIRGQVIADDSEQPLAGARVSLADRTTTTTDAEGRYEIANVPTGFEVVSASAPGYADGSGTADVGQGADNPDVLIRLKKAKTVTFDQKQLRVGEALTLSTILFDQGKAELKRESKPELDKVAAFLKANPTAEIELSGHTSSEGEAESNRLLSYRRVRACKAYVVAKGGDAARIITVGLGPDRPIAPNNTEPGRKQNRRVELRVTKN